MRRSQIYLLGALAALAAGCGKAPSAPSAPTPSVQVITVKTQDAPIYREVVATLLGSVTTEIRPRVRGYLDEQVYGDGQFVEQGDLLFEIDDAQFLIAVESARAQLAKQKAQLVKAQLDVGRDEELIKAQAVSQKQLDNARQAEQAAQAEVDAARAAVAQAELNLSYCTVYSPITGLAGRAQAELGDLVGPTSVMATISTIDPIQAEFNIPESMYMARASAVREIMAMPLEERPQSLELVLGNDDVFPYKGKFQYLDREIGVGTGSIRVYGLFPNPERVLRPGQYARIRAKVEDYKDAIEIPQRAIQETQGSFSVFVLGSDGTVKETAVEQGPVLGSNVIITKGLKAGDQVVVEGIQRLRDGAKVNASPWRPTGDKTGNAGA